MALDNENRVYVSVIFTDSHELEFRFPIALMDRQISHFEVDGTRYLIRRERDWDDVEVVD